MAWERYPASRIGVENKRQMLRNYRYFSIFLFALGLLAAFGEKPVTPTPPGPVTPGSYTVSGAVLLDDGTPLAGVTVSDGYACTVTDDQGKYYLDSDFSQRDYVFVSTPSHASAPVVGGLPVFWKFYKDLEKGSDGRYSGVNFTLNKIARPDFFTIFIFADPQPRSRSAGYDKMAYHSLDCCNDMYRDMKELRATMTDRPVYGIGLGDIVHRELTLMPQYIKGMADAGVVTYNVIGNHDHDVSKPDDRTACKTFESYVGPTNFSFNLGGIHFIVLDDMIAPDESTGKGRDECSTGLTDEIWQWLQNDLSYVPFNTTLMVCAHSPMFRLLGGGERSGALHYADYRNLFSKYAKVYAWAGHTHTTCNYVNLENPVIETHTLTRVTGPLWTNEYMGSNGTPRGYVVLDCEDGTVSWRFKPTFYQSGAWSATYPAKYDAPAYAWRDWDYGADGRAVMRGSSDKYLDGSYQMQLFPPGTYGDDYLYANIFLWDELWKKPVFHAGGVPAAMTRVTDKKVRYSFSDAEMRTYYREHNKNLSAESSFAQDSNNCESMFRVYVDPKGPKSGTVKVTDRFGNEYSSTITW